MLKIFFCIKILNPEHKKIEVGRTTVGGKKRMRREPSDFKWNM